jgi:zinc transport system substrate-binding protein
MPRATVLLGAGLAGCLGPPDADVLATFYPITFLVGSVTGDTVRVAQILGPGTEPHDWEPSVRDVSRIASADLVFAQGRDFEPWLERIVGNLGDRAPRTVHLAEALGPLPDVEDRDHGHADEHEGGHDTHDGHEEDEHDRGDVDPHTWLDPVLMARKVVAVQSALSATYPEHADRFRANAASVSARLTTLHESFETRLADCETRHVVVQHNAFGYLAARYGFEVHSATGLNPEAEPSAQTIARIIDLTRQHDITVVFTETLANPQVMNTIARETGAQVRVLSPLEARSSEETQAGLDYVGLMERNLDELATAMRCTSA